MELQLEFKLALEQMGFLDASYSDKLLFQRRTNNTNLIVAIYGNNTATVYSGYVAENKVFASAMNGKGLEIAVARASLQQLTGDEW